ncbi:uncharacterized protein LOC144773667 [Lissotriton helveticus]
MTAEAPAQMLSTSPGVDPWAYEEKPDLQALPMGLHRGRRHLKGDPPRTRGPGTSKHEDLFLINNVTSSPVQMKLEPQNSQRCEDLQEAPRSGHQDFKVRWWSGEEDEGRTSDSQDSADLEPGKNSTRGPGTSKHEDLFLINNVTSSPVQMKLEPQNSQHCEDLQEAPRSGHQTFKARWWSAEEDEGRTSDSQDSADLEPGKNSTRGLVTFKQEDFLMSNDYSSSSVSLKKESPESQSREGQESQAHDPKDLKKHWWSNEEEGHAWDRLDPSDTGHVKTFITGVDPFRPEGDRVSHEGQISTVEVKLEHKDSPIILGGPHNPLHIVCQDFGKSWQPGEEDEGPRTVNHDTTENLSRKKHKLENPEECSADLESAAMVHAGSSEKEETSDTQNLLQMNAEYPPPLPERVPKSSNSSEEQGAKTPSMTYICNKCGKCFDSASSHVCQHVYKRSYTGDKPYKCDQCPESFSVYSALLIHQGTHRKGKQYVCSECGIKCASVLRLLTHEKAHKRSNEKGKVYQCRICEKGFHDSLHLKLHHQEHADMDALNQHSNASPEGNDPSLKELTLKTKLNVNSECGKGLTSAMVSHLKTHTGEMLYQCDECGLSCASALQLLQHQETHAGLNLEGQLFQCPKCEQSFYDSWSLTIHQQEHARVEMPAQDGDTSPKAKNVTFEDLNLRVKPHSCSECGSRFKLESTLRSHLKKHTVENSYPCIECGLKCDSASHLLEHLKIHSEFSKTGLHLEEELFQCFMCEKRFCDLGTLAIHQRQHKELGNISQQNNFPPAEKSLNSENLTRSTKPHLCGECGKTFKLESRLRSHLKTHIGEILFPCTECGKKCVSAAHLMKHLKIHTGLSQDSVGELDRSEKPHLCFECGKRFKLESTLRSHLKIHTVDNPYPCIECGLKCDSASHLAEHQKTHNIFTKIKLNLDTESFPGLGQKEDIFQCQTCEMKFCDLRSLRTHQQEHAAMENMAKLGATSPHRKNVNFEELNFNIKPHLCTECGKRFKLETTLISHLKIHAGKKPFPCSECGKTCVSAPHLIEHQKIHTGLTKTKTNLDTLTAGLKLKEEVFLCYTCDMIFSDSLSLTLHEQEHTSISVITLDGDSKPERNNVNLEESNRRAKPNSCSDCGQSFDLESALISHLQTHAEQKLFQCSKCGVTCDSASHLTEHQESHTGELQLKEVHQCQSCEQTFWDLQSLAIHQQEHTEKATTTQEADTSSEKKNLSAEEVKVKKPHACTDCDKRFTLKSKLISHLKLHTGERPFTCSECGKTFRDTILLRKHQLIHTEEKPYSCSDCGKTFSVKGYLFRHQKIHTGNKPHLCKICGRGFTHASTRIKHEQTHAGLKPYRCDECGKHFSDTSSVMKHQLTHTGEKPFSCSECGKSFGRSCHLIRHLKMHSGELPYVCSECGQSFADSSSLTKHRLSHTGAKPYACELCGKNFGRSSHLNRHQQIHTGEKPFPCDECGRRFGALSTLLKHQRIHTGEKPYMCIECKKSFRDASSLKIHQRVHTGEKPYVCRECGVSFSRSVYLKKHHVQHTGMNSYTCDCGLIFTNSIELGEHQLKHTEVVTHTL